MKQLSLTEAYAPFESFFESETLRCIILGINIAAFIFILFFLFLYIKFSWLKKGSVESKNKLKKNRLFRFLFSLGFFALGISLLYILFHGLNYIFDYIKDTFGIVILSIIFSVFILVNLAYLIIREKGFFSKKDN